MLVTFKWDYEIPEDGTDMSKYVGWLKDHAFTWILCLWFRASLIHINNCPTRCNTKQSIYYSASSLYMFRVSATPIIRSTQNCNYSLRYWSYFLCSYLPPTSPRWSRWREVAAVPVPEAVVTVLCTPDGGCGWYPKHVDWTCRIINRLLCVASCWTVINVVFRWVFYLCSELILQMKRATKLVLVGTSCDKLYPNGMKNEKK